MRFFSPVRDSLVAVAQWQSIGQNNPPTPVRFRPTTIRGRPEGGAILLERAIVSGSRSAAIFNSNPR